MTQGPYSDTVMDHFTHPRNMGEIKDRAAWPRWETRPVAM